MSLIEVPFPDLPMRGQSTQSAPLEVSGRIRIGKRRRVQWGDLQIWTMLFVTAIGGRLHDKEQAQADAQSSSKTARP